MKKKKAKKQPMSFAGYKPSIDMENLELTVASYYVRGPFDAPPVGSKPSLN